MHFLKKLTLISITIVPGWALAQTAPTTQASSDAAPTSNAVDVKAVEIALGRIGVQNLDPGKARDLQQVAVSTATGTDPVDWSDVDSKLGQLRLDWQAKYGQQFSPSGKDLVLFSEPNNQVTEKIIEVDGKPSKTTVDVTLSKDGDAPAVTIRLEKSKDGWKMLGPISEKSLHDALSAELDQMDAGKANWPADVDHAYGFAIHHALAAAGKAVVSGNGR